MRAEGGSVSAAAGLAGLDQRLVQAAVDYYAEHGAGTVPTPAAGDGTSVLQVVTQAFALFTGITTVVYVAGSIVLALRLAFAHVPWEPVIGQLPREFIVSTGAGQILLPALAVSAIYATFRLLRGGDADVPNSKRWQDASSRGLVVLRTMGVSALLLAPAVLFFVLRDREVVLEGELVGVSQDVWGPILAYLIILVTTALFRELRAFVAKHYRERWNGVTPTAVMCGVYGLAVVPALIAFWAALPLGDAKVCSTTGFEERGYLVGQTSDRIYLGERRLFRRRLAVIPLSQVEELFIGPSAGDASCDVPDAQAAITGQAQADEAISAAQQADRAASGLSTADGKTLAERAKRVDEAAGAAGLATFAVGNAARSAVPEQARATQRDGDEAIRAARRLRESAQAFEDAPAAVRARALEDLRRAIAAAVQATQTAARSARALADEMTSVAKRAALDS